MSKEYNHHNHSEHDSTGHDHPNYSEHDHSGHDHHNHSEHEPTEHDHHAHSEHEPTGHDHHDHSAHDHSAHDHTAHAHHDHSGHDHHGHGDFKSIFFQSLWLGIPIMLLAPFFGLTEKGIISFPYSDIVVAVLATILLFLGGKPFFQGGLAEVRKRKPGMMALVSLGVGVSYIYSVYAVVANYTSGAHVMDFFFEFASLILIMLLGHWIEMKALGDAGDAQAALAALLPKDAQVVGPNEEVTTKPLAQLQMGDVVRVQAGENIPADGVIIRGTSRVNEALLTGESKPIEKQVGDQAIGGSTNGSGVLFIEIQEVGEKSFIAQVQQLVGQAQNQPSRAEDLANKVASYLFWIAVGVALLAFIVWYALADLPTAIRFTITTLIIACPHALGLAIPMVISRSTSLGAARGLLVKNREAYELTTKADVIVMDKTGTLTTGEFKVLATTLLQEELSEATFIGLLAGIEAGSSHPIAQSIIAYSQERQVPPMHFDSVEVLSGEGVVGQAGGKTYRLVSQKAYGQPLDVKIPVGATLSVLTQDDVAVGTVALGDDLKASSKELMKVLKEQGIEPVIATGDNESAAKSVADELNVTYYANQSPQDKYDLIERFKAEGKTVVMVGDGVNDAPSLALADVGVAIGAGTQVALDTADVILTQSDPGDIESFIELSLRTNRKMKQNLAWGAGYNFIAIPVAAGLLAPLGITLAPAVGAILMSASTVIVAINAMTLKLDEVA